MTAHEPRDGGIAEDADGELWKMIAPGRWQMHTPGRAGLILPWDELLYRFGPLHVYVWRATARPAEAGA